MGSKPELKLKSTCICEHRFIMLIEEIATLAFKRNSKFVAKRKNMSYSLKQLFNDLQWEKKTLSSELNILIVSLHIDLIVYSPLK